MRTVIAMVAPEVEIITQQFEGSVIKPPKSPRTQTTHGSSPKQYKKPRLTTSDPMELLERKFRSIVGLGDAKEAVRQVVQTVTFEQKRRKAGIRGNSGMSLHMAFLGNAGTGKTTFARIVGEVLAEIGALSKGGFFEADITKLVGQYVGQTPHLVEQVVHDALGGVLFIDEAYSLVQTEYGNSASHGKEAIDTLIKLMEDNRKDLCVIFAGYPTLMQKFLDSNEGLRSRVPFVISFEDYSPDEFIQIISIEAKLKNYKVSNEVLGSLLSQFTEINIGEQGNGRLARNIVEKAIRNKAARHMSHPDKDLINLKLEDFGDWRNSLRR
jgi:stage V sporulation protein K